MYSIVMIAALSSGADVTPPPAPAPHAVAPAPVVVGCCGGGLVAGCTGCYGSYYSSCYGCCGGYSSCHGCCGGGRGGFLGLRHKHGCCGGYTCFGCCGGCGGYSSYYAGCSGLSCFGSCYGSSCHGCSGSVWGPPVGMPPYTLHGYNTPGAPVWGAGYPVVGGCYGSPSAVYGSVYYPNQPPVTTVPVAPPAKPSSDNTPSSGANLKFDLPADAKLFVDGKPVADGGLARTFYTPALAPGQDYYYEVYAERTVGGKVVPTEKKKVIVSAGKTINVSFGELTASGSVVTK